jgi:hypothetical protein
MAVKKLIKKKKDFVVEPVPIIEFKLKRQTPKEVKR